MISDEERWAAEDANSPRPFAVPAVQGVPGDRVSDTLVNSETAIGRILVDHTRLNGISGECSCGYTVPLGLSFALHQARAIVTAGLAIAPSEPSAVQKEPTQTREGLAAWLREGGRWGRIRAKDEHDAARALLASDLWEGGETE